MKLKEILTDNKRLILTGIAIGEVLFDSYLWYKAGLKIDKILKERKEDIDLCDQNDKEAIKAVNVETAKKVAPIVIGPVLMTAVTIGTIIFSYKITTKDLMVLSSAYALTKDRLKETREKMMEVVGEKKVAEVDGKIAEDFVNKNMTESTEIIPTPFGDTPCIDYYTGRMFYTNIQKIESVRLELSARLAVEMFVSLNDFYELVGLAKVDPLYEIGWNAEDLVRGLIDMVCKPIVNEYGQTVLAVHYPVSTRRKEWM